MNNTISYSVLKYTHSRFLGESLNIGVLFFFPELDGVEFYASKKLTRLHELYPGISDKLIKNYLRSFEKRVKQLSKHLPDYISDPDRLVRDHLLVEDASPLQFEKCRHAIFYSDVETVKKQYIDLLLGIPFSEKDAVVQKLNDQGVTQRCKRIILAKRPEIKDYLKSDDQRIIRNNLVSFRSDFYWQNGTTNFVKGVSFDLQSKENIIDKSLLIYGQLSQLESTFSLRNTRIDLLLHKPSDPVLFDAYKEAVRIIEQPNLNKQLVRDEDLDAYTDRVIEEIEPL